MSLKRFQRCDMNKRLNLMFDGSGGKAMRRTAFQLVRLCIINPMLSKSVFSDKLRLDAYLGGIPGWAVGCRVRLWIPKVRAVDSCINRPPRPTIGQYLWPGFRQPALTR